MLSFFCKLFFVIPTQEESQVSYQSSLRFLLRRNDKKQL